MKKLILVVICLGLGAILACSSNKNPLAAPIPQEKMLYGITRDGVFFIHDSLVKNAGGDSTNVASQATEWKPRQMSRIGDYHIYDCNDRNPDKALFVFYKNFKIQYCFFIDKHSSIPAIFEDKKEVKQHIDFGDVVVTLESGMVFFTQALEEDPQLW